MKFPLSQDPSSVSSLQAPEEGSLAYAQKVLANSHHHFEPYSDLLMTLLIIVVWGVLDSESTESQY